MIARPSLRSVRSSVDRADAARAAAETLRSADDEWFAACLASSAYHLVKAAMLGDPIFDSPDELRLRDPRLTPESRFITTHQGLRGADGRSLGLTDVVRILYPAIAVEYERLHMASRDIHYGDGLGVISAESVIDDYSVIRDAWDSELLRADETESGWS